MTGKTTQGAVVRKPDAYGLERLTDLTPKNLDDLRKIRDGEAASIHPSARIQFVKDGLAERVETFGLFGAQPALGERALKLSEHGKEVLARAEAYLAGTWQPPKSLLSAKDMELLEKASKVSIANRLKKHLNLEVDSTGVKLMLALAKSPESNRWLGSVYGYWTMPKIAKLGLIAGESKRGALWMLTRTGALALAEAASILRKEKKT